MPHSMRSVRQETVRNGVETARDDVEMAPGDIETTRFHVVSATFPSSPPPLTKRKDPASSSGVRPYGG
jgi:hypothetical protein